MTAHAKWEYVKVIYPRYRQAPRREKQPCGSNGIVAAILAVPGRGARPVTAEPPKLRGGTARSVE
ncbi:MAG TPA: hypothetical protein VJ144_04305 [Candidatus Polarisedimenticolia bacterium]|nr:hypothetical protein [Candidatus Polarisedimenticolia bacterium]